MKNIKTLLLILLSYYSFVYPIFAEDMIFSTLTGSINGVSSNAMEVDECSNGAIDLDITSPNGPFTIQWSNGELTQNIYNLSSGEYCVTVSDSQCGRAVGCWTVKCCPFLMEEEQIQFEVINPACEGAKGILELSIFDLEEDAFPFSIYLENQTDFKKYDKVISSSASIFSDLTEGNYDATINYGGGCTFGFGFDIELSNIEIQFETTPSCDNDGTITSNVFDGESPYTYAWADDPTETTQNRSGLGSNLYTLVVTDSNGCSNMASVFVKDSDPINLDNLAYDIQPSQCNDATGSINIYSDPDGGSAPFTFEWSNGSVGKNLNNIQAGDYELLITDYEGCTIATEFAVPESGKPEILNEVVDNTCSTLNSGSIGVLAASTNGGGLNYNWSNGDSGFIIENLSAGIYTVTVTDLSNSCEIVNTYEVEEFEVDPIFLSETVVNDCSSSSGSSGKISLSISGGKPPYGILWSNGNTSYVNSNLNAGNYSVTIDDQCGNEVIETYTIIDNKLDFEFETDLNQGETTISLNLISGTGPFTYSWSTNESTSSIKVTENGEYHVTVSDETDCSFESSIVIDVSCPPISVDINSSGFNASCSSTTYFGFDPPFSGTLPFQVKILLDGDIVHNSIFDSYAELNSFQFWNQGQSGVYEITIIDNCGQIYKETFTTCLNCNYENGSDGDDLYVTLFKKYIKLVQKCPCENDCGILEFTTDKLKLEVDKDGILNDVYLPFGSTQFIIKWPDNESNTRIIKSAVSVNGQPPEYKVDIYGIEEYVFSDDEYDSGSVEVTVQFLLNNELECEVTIPFLLGDGGYNGYFHKIKIKPGFFNPFPIYGNIFNGGTVACSTKCKQIPIETGVLYANEPLDPDDEDDEYVKKCESNTDLKLSFFSYDALDYNDPCFGGGVLETHFETSNGIIKGIKYIAPGVALDEWLNVPYPLFSSYESYSEYSCPASEPKKGYCLFDALDVYGVNLNHKLIVEYCENFYYDPPIDTDEDGIPDDVDPCPLNPDVFCDPTNDDDDDGTLGGGGTNTNGCRVIFSTEPCQLITVCSEDDGSVETQQGTITEQTFSGTSPCLHCFKANICNVVDNNTGVSYSGIVGPVDEINIEIQTTYDESNNCDDQCTITFLCEGNSIGWLCGGVDCTTTNNDICTYSELVDIIENSIVGNNELETFVRRPNSDDRIEFDVYPNPSSGEFNIDILSSYEYKPELTISTIDGKILLKQGLSVAIGHNIVPISVNIEHGIYLISLKTNKDVKTIKHVIY